MEFPSIDEMIVTKNDERVADATETVDDSTEVSEPLSVDQMSRRRSLPDDESDNSN